jgi:hypothetical protein
MESFFNIRNEYPLMKINSGLPTTELHLVHSRNYLCDYQTSQRAVIYQTSKNYSSAILVTTNSNIFERGPQIQSPVK